MEKKRFFRLLSVLVILVSILTVMVCSLIVEDTSTRYIKREQDEIRAYYTGLYFDQNGDGSPVALENNVGFVDFQIMNYIDDNVTKRDITYDIKTIDKFYNDKGVEIAKANLPKADKLYVKDVWNNPQEIGKDSYKYDVSITNNDGETRTEPVNEVDQLVYLFSYEERDESAVGKVHNVTVKIKRKGEYGEMSGSSEQVSLVIQLNKPYKQVYIVDILVSNRLIVFGQKTVQEFDMDVTKVNVQTFDIFSHTEDKGTYVPRTNQIGGTFTSKAFKVVFEWDNMIVNQNDFLHFHNNQLDILVSNPLYIPDGLDISEPYLVNINQTSDYGTLEMYVPQSSSFTFNCMITDENAYMHAKVYVYDSASSKYVLYNQDDWGGYSDDEVLGLAKIIG